MNYETIAEMFRKFEQTGEHFNTPEEEKSKVFYDLSTSRWSSQAEQYKNVLQQGYELVGVTDNAPRSDDMFLYALNTYDKNMYKGVKLKSGEVLFRYKTRNSHLGGLFPVIKINVKRKLLYFADQESSDRDDVNLKFDGRGIKLPYIRILDLFAKKYNLM
jgi:hypothetical protein